MTCLVNSCLHSKGISSFVEARASVGWSTPDGSHTKMSCTFSTVNKY